jgi:hypothetical protein
MVNRYYIGLAGKPAARFMPYTSISGDVSQETELANLYGIPAAVLTIQVVTYINNNPIGKLKVNASEVFINNTFTVTLDSSGRGSFTAQVSGDSTAHGTTVLGKFEIISTSIGSIITDTTKDYQISKVF